MKRSPKANLLVETFIVYVCAILCIAAVKTLRRPNLEGMVIIAVFLVAPVIILEKGRRDFKEYGLSGYSMSRSLLIGIIASLVILPFFTLGYVLMHRLLPRLPLISMAELQKMGVWHIFRSIYP